MGCRPAGNDINPLSEMLVGPRLDPVAMPAVAKRLRSIGPQAIDDTDDELTVILSSRDLAPHPSRCAHGWRAERQPVNSIPSIVGSAWWRSIG